METYATPYAFILFGWVVGLTFHIAIHFVIKGWTSFRLFDFWSGPRTRR